MKDAIRITFEVGKGENKLQLVRYVTFEEMRALARTQYPAICLERSLMSFWDDVLLMGAADK